MASDELCPACAHGGVCMGATMYGACPATCASNLETERDMVRKQLDAR